MECAYFNVLHSPNCRPARRIWFYFWCFGKFAYLKIDHDNNFLQLWFEYMKCCILYDWHILHHYETVNFVSRDIERKLCIVVTLIWIIRWGFRITAIDKARLKTSITRQNIGTYDTKTNSGYTVASLTSYKTGSKWL